MTSTWLRNTRTMLVGALGAMILLGSPLMAQADQGKWWTPKEGGRDTRTRVSERTRDNRGQRDVWRGARVQRDVIVIRDGSRGNYFRARRFTVRPRFHRHVVYVRPIRFFIAADARIGGIGVHARFRPHYLYGCNFCDARFESYDRYRSHVMRCDAGPHGFNVAASDWDEERDAGRGPQYNDEDRSPQHDDEDRWDD